LNIYRVFASFIVDRDDQQITGNPLIKPRRPYINKTLKKIGDIPGFCTVSVANYKSNDLLFPRLRQKNA
jgi:hypothetical protein